MKKTGKKLLAVLFAVALLLCAVPAGSIAVSAEQSGDYEYEVLEDGTASITKYNGDGGDVVIPGEIDGYKVTKIGNNTFDSCDTLTSVTIPNGVKTIMRDAFANCTLLSSITLPDTMISIGIRAFYNTEYYNNSNNWDNGLLYIGHHLIAADADKLPEKVNVRLGTITIGDGTFDAMNKMSENGEPSSSLKSVTLPAGLRYIGFRAFAYCGGLQSMVIPNGVDAIFNETFMYCTNLETITIPDSVQSIGHAAFFECRALKEIHIPQGVSSIDFESFTFCSSLTAIDIPYGVTVISGFAFSDCAALTSITIPDSVTTIGWSAFADCTSLTSVTVPSSVTDIGDYAFGYRFMGQDLGYQPIPGFTISGFTGTAAERYANENGFAFIALDNAGDSLSDVDTNHDGEISTAEAQAFYTNFYKALTNGNPPSGADVSGDGRVDIEDVLTVYLIASGKKVA